MSVQNSLVKKQQGNTFSAYITQDAIKNKINQMVGGKDGQRFITSIISAVSINPALAECDHGTILSAAMLGESLKLSPSPQLGQYYLVPYEDNKNNRKVATFQLGYKGYIQLAIRSGYYKKINVLPIKEGELKSFDPLNEVIECVLIEDEETREKAPTIGYYAMFEYHNGFRKVMYWSKEKMEHHALTYSKGYAADKKKGTAWTFWTRNFDDMACKTMLRQLISKWGIMSIELQNAMEKDMAVIDESGKVEYVDNMEFENVIDVKGELPEQGQTEVTPQKNKKAKDTQEDAQDEFFKQQ